MTPDNPKTFHNKDKMKIAVLISGGVDSAVTVDMLYKEGHELHLFYIRIGMDNGEGDCSADEDIELCTLIAQKYNLLSRLSLCTRNIGTMSCNMPSTLSKKV